MKNLIILTFILLFNINSLADAALVTNFIEPVKYFINHRVQLKELFKKLTIYQKASLLGISGIGKTQLARKYAHYMQDKYKIIWFFNCNSDLNEQFAELAKSINQNSTDNFFGEKLSEELTDAKKDVIEFLTPKKNWLLVFDNLTLGQNNSLKDILSWENNGHIIFCSQEGHNLQQVIQLSHLTKDDSIELVNNIMNESTPHLALDLAEEYKGYPIMIAQGAIFLKNNKHMNVEDYKQIINKSEDKIVAHVSHILKQLTPSAYDLIYKAALLNNQNFSKGLLLNITKFPQNFADDLYSITSRFNLITTIDEKENNPIFEMHDTIKQAILKIGRKKLTQQHLTEIINKINSFIKPGLPVENSNLSSNLQKILENAEIYSVNTLKIMEIRKSIFTYYMNNLLDYYNCQKMVDWFTEQEKKNSFNLWLMSPTEKAIYVDYLNNIACYEDIGKSDPQSAIVYFNKAKKILEKIKDNLDLKFEIYAGLAQTQIFSGDLEHGENELKLVEQLIENNPKYNFPNLGLFYFIKAKLALMLGKYEDALVSINQSLEKYSDLPADSLFIAAVKIQKAEVLNYLGSFEEAEKLSKSMYLQLKDTIKEDHEMHARALRQLSRAESGLKNFDHALEYAQEAKKIYINDKFRKNSDLAVSHDVDLADAFVAEGISLTGLIRFNEAISAYALAETLYYNTYRANMKNIDNISNLYYLAARAAAKLPDPEYFNRYKNLHSEMFGPTNERTEEINKMLVNQ